MSRPTKLLGVPLEWRFHDGHELEHGYGKRGGRTVCIERGWKGWQAIVWLDDRYPRLYAHGPTPERAAANLRRRVAKLREALR